MHWKDKTLPISVNIMAADDLATPESSASTGSTVNITAAEDLVTPGARALKKQGIDQEPLVPKEHSSSPRLGQWCPAAVGPAPGLLSIPSSASSCYRCCHCRCPPVSAAQMVLVHCLQLSFAVVAPVDQIYLASLLHDRGTAGQTEYILSQPYMNIFITEKFTEILHKYHNVNSCNGIDYEG